MPLPIAQIVVVDGVEHRFTKRAEARAFQARVKAQGVAKRVYMRAEMSPAKGTDDSGSVSNKSSNEAKPKSA